MKRLLMSAFLAAGWLCAIYGITYVPYDCPYPCETIKHSVLPSTNPVPTAWVAAATVIPGEANDGYIEVDWMQLLDLDAGGVVVNENHFNDNGMLHSWLGGLYNRWFPPGDDHTQLSNSNVSDGILRIDVGTMPNNVSHWWLPRYVGIPGHSYALRMRFRVFGHIGVQLGCDFWEDTSITDPSANMEAWLSDWYGDTNGEFIEVTSPLPEAERVRFDRNHYGFYNNGQFFISRQLVEYIGATQVYYGSDTSPMTLDGDRYIVNRYQYLPNPQVYCFRITNPYVTRWIPHGIIDHLQCPEDAIDNGLGGYNFYTPPTPAVSVDDQYNPSPNFDCEVRLGADYSCIISAKNSTPQISEVSFYDLRGRRVFKCTMPTLDDNTKISVPLTRMPVQMLIVKVTTSSGESVVKKLNLLP
jgi:hypothetical protein